MDALTNTSCVQTYMILEIYTSVLGYDINPLLCLFAGAERGKGQDVPVLLLNVSLQKCAIFGYFN